MTGIYISYRRDDSLAVAGRLCDDLADAFGRERVSMDFDDMPPGEDFSSYMERKLRETTVLLVLIGPRWLAVTDAEGTRRIDSTDDFVRFEIATALHVGMPVVPVLVDDTPFPQAEQLPGDLGALITRQGINLSSDRWRADVARLVVQLERLIGAPTRTAGGPLASVKRWFGDASGAAPDRPAATMTREVPRPAPTFTQSPAPAAASEVFVSYAFEDESWAQSVVGALEAQGYACFVASRDIVPGSPSYARDVVRAIKGSRLLVVLLSQASNASDDVLSEITLAKNHKVPRLALRIDEAQLDDGFDYFFAQAQRLDAGRLDMSEALSRLCASVLRQIGPAQRG